MTSQLRCIYVAYQMTSITEMGKDFIKLLKLISIVMEKTDSIL